MDDERRVREELERLASDLPPATRPPARFRTMARWRMVRTGTIAAITAVALVVGTLAVGDALGRSPSTPAGGPTQNATAGSTTSPQQSIPHIAFQSDRSGNEDIWIMDVDGSNPRNLTDDPADESDPSWSPDGTRIAFVSDRGGNKDIYAMDADGSHVVDLTNTPTVLETTPAWSPDGSTIAYGRSEGDASGQIWLMGADGSNQHVLVSERLGDLHPAWSPDGSQIAFFGFGARISVVNADGTGARQLTGGPDDVDPNWCPDGSPIAFTRVGSPPQSSSVAPTDIWYVTPTGGAPGRVTHDGVSGEPVWSPSGTVIAFVRWPGAQRHDFEGDIYVMNANGSDVQALTSGPADDGSPAWQPKG
jgi:Tol biopolymer transport system component